MRKFLTSLMYDILQYLVHTRYKAKVRTVSPGILMSPVSVHLCHMIYMIV